MLGKTVFVTGGAGYIGSHCLVELLNAGYNVIAIDNFTNSVADNGTSPCLRRVEKITGKKIIFYECDLLDGPKLQKIFRQHKIDCVIHFAALKAVGESMQLPLRYYKNNLIGVINLLEAMEAVGCYQLVFSSSCCVYGDPEFLPITEDHPTGKVTNVYGRTKYFIEEMLKDLSTSNEKWNIITLRYFNPVGAHQSGLIGEDPTKEFTNLMPYIGQVALGNKPQLTIFGMDYNTKDGTGVRDYIHVMDLATGHVAALKKLLGEHLQYKVYNLGLGHGISVLELVGKFIKVTGIQVPTVICQRRYGDVATLICDGNKALKELDWTYNLGSGSGVSVLELARLFEKVTGKTVKIELKDRREGDIVSMFANPTLAKIELGWEPKFTVEIACEDFWRWQTMNPNGYRDDCEVNKKKATTNGHNNNGTNDGLNGNNGTTTSTSN